MIPTKKLLIVLARNPLKGRVKTRLARDIGDDQALKAYRILLQHTVTIATTSESDTALFHSEPDPPPAAFIPERGRTFCQTGNDLGERINNAFITGFSQGYQHIVLIGSDCLDIRPSHIKQAFALLDTHAAVIGPSLDGGFYLVGLTTPVPKLFLQRTWSHEKVLEETIARLEALELRFTLMDTLADIDTFPALEASRLWAPLSIIIPTFNEQETIEATLQQLTKLTATYVGPEIIIADASTDNTACIAQYFPDTTIIRTEKGRARQMNCGAAHAHRKLLYFLHADTIPPPGFVQHILRATENGARAGCFQMRFDKEDPLLGLYGWFTRFPLPVCRGGDQSLFITRELFDTIGGYNENMLLMEDYDIVSRIEQITPVHILPATVTTSARKFLRNGTLELQLHFAMLHLKRALGTSQEELAEYYRQHIKT